MKVVNSLKSAKKRDKNCKIVRRKGRIYVINKSNPRFKARQGEEHLSRAGLKSPLPLTRASGNTR